MSFQKIISPDDPLLLRLKEGNRNAFDEIFNRFADPLHTYIRGRLEEPDDAADVLQEVFIRLWHKRRSITIHSSFRNYLYTIVQHCICDHLRAARRKKYTLTADIPEDTPERIQPDELYQYKQVYRIWKDAINKLPGQMRRIYALKKESELSVKEIAAELQLSEQTVKNQLHTARQRIVKILQEVKLMFF